MRSSLFTAAILMMGLIMPASAGSLEVEFEYRNELSAQQNYQRISEKAHRACKQAMRRSDTLVERLSREPRKACTAELINGAIAEFDRPALTQAHNKAQKTQFARLF